MVPKDGGITEFGRAVVAEVNRLKMLIDFSHVGHRTAADGIAASTRPPAITHSGCYDLTPHPRNMPDAQMRALADKGGVFGIYLMCYLVTRGQEHKDDVLRHIEHAIQVCGEDHVGIGTDGVVPPLVLDKAYRDYWRTEVYEPRVKNGTVAPNEGADIFNYTPEYNVSDRYALIGDDLIRRGHSLARVEKILGGNFARLYSEAWG
jgi:membrane dipeptidase